MIPTRFEYVAPRTAADVVAALDGESRLLAGGTWVVPEMGRAESRPRRVVDLRRAGLATISVEGSRLRLGAMCTYSDLLSSEDVTRHAPLLRTMASGVTGGSALRNQATIGGSVAAARPQSDVPATLVALRADAVVAGPAGSRRVPTAELFLGAGRTTLAVDEVITGFDLPSERMSGHGYVKLKRGGSSWPIVTAAALLRLDDDGRCETAHLVLGGVEAVPMTVDLTIMLGRPLGDQELDVAAARTVAALSAPWTDVLAPGDYRAAVAAPAARRALAMARANVGVTEGERHGRRPDCP
ncbi:carbon-monoxide dehydrogenase medium subunit [Saccharothrix tamanrassetensis]|uniref:Carbon-monoxide dehydrogenase medium subunit n=1 Tax=Saccharothrix tamanrassetensis TaxID=1051531 RepID=A0A841CJY3_9PSEU|nr:FAD binding domain-containing protein [Saccharothrix tamanrassetensis]MBB5957273.1 carbon-monoxide dehydrogenase medium subunit [Saccharothrix tamanrassetensis]